MLSEILRRCETSISYSSNLGSNESSFQGQKFQGQSSPSADGHYLWCFNGLDKAAKNEKGKKDFLPVHQIFFMKI